MAGFTPYDVVQYQGYTPMSTQDIMAPAAYMAQQQASLEDEYSKVNDELEKVKFLVQHENNPQLQQQYDDYYNRLQQAQNDLSSKGFSAINRRQMLGIRSQYQSQIAPISVAAQMKAKDIEAYNQMKAKDPTYIGKDPSSMGLMDYINNNLQPFAEQGVSGATVTEMTRKMAEPFSQNLTDTQKEVLARDLIIKANPDAPQQWVDTEVNYIKQHGYKPGTPGYEKIANYIRQTVTQSLGIHKWATPEEYEQYKGFVEQGLPYLQGKEDAQYIDRNNAFLRAQQAQTTADARVEAAKEKAAASKSKQSAQSLGFLSTPIDIEVSKDTDSKDFADAVRIGAKSASADEFDKISGRGKYGPLSSNDYAKVGVALKFSEPFRGLSQPDFNQLKEKLVKNGADPTTINSPEELAAAWIEYGVPIPPTANTKGGRVPLSGGDPIGDALVGNTTANWSKWNEFSSGMSETLKNALLGAGRTWGDNLKYTLIPGIVSGTPSNNTTAVKTLKALAAEKNQQGVNQSIADYYNSQGQKYTKEDVEKMSDSYKAGLRLIKQDAYKDISAGTSPAESRLVQALLASPQSMFRVVDENGKVSSLKDSKLTMGDVLNKNDGTGTSKDSYAQFKGLRTRDPGNYNKAGVSWVVRKGGKEYLVSVSNPFIEDNFRGYNQVVDQIDNSPFQPLRRITIDGRDWLLKTILTDKGPEFYIGDGDDNWKSLEEIKLEGLSNMKSNYVPLQETASKLTMPSYDPQGYLYNQQQSH